MYECTSYANIKAIAQEAFGSFIQPGLVLSLEYSFMAPVDGIAEREVLVTVNSQSSFETFLKVWDELVKPRQIRAREHILPVLCVVQTVPVVVPESPPRDRSGGQIATAPVNESFQFTQTVPSAAVVASASSNFLADDAQGAVKRNKSARAPSQSAATPRAADVQNIPAVARMKSSAPPTDGTARVQHPLLQASGGAASVEDSYAASRQKAAELLRSFKKSDLVEEPTIRLVMRCGESSVRIPFDIGQRPDLESLRRKCKAELTSRLAATGEDLALLLKREFVLSASINDCRAEIDLDDQRDVHLLCDAIKACGNDYSCFLIADLKAAAGEEPALPGSLIVDSLLYLDRESLEVNLCHTPLKKKERRKNPDKPVDLRGIIVPPPFDPKDD
jgi:hypothetical protein